MRYVCSICGYVYDEKDTVAWAELPGDWKCPLCGAAKADFAPEGAAPAAAGPVQPTAETGLRPLTALETSALCTNLAKGCEKQYHPEQAEAFRKLAAWFRGKSEAAPDPAFDQLLEKIGRELESGFPAAETAARQDGDRGALRSLTWSQKVTRIQKALLERYQREGEAMLENAGVYVCTICGFIYVGNDLPEVCPVCKVPKAKFERIGG